MISRISGGGLCSILAPQGLRHGVTITSLCDTFSSALSDYDSWLCRRRLRMCDVSQAGEPIRWSTAAGFCPSLQTHSYNMQTFVIFSKHSRNQCIQSIMQHPATCHQFAISSDTQQLPTTRTKLSHVTYRFIPMHQQCPVDSIGNNQ